MPAGSWPLVVDPASVWRLGINPAQILGRSGAPAGGPGITLNRERWEGAGWYMPGFPTWGLRDTFDECPYIARAIERYGVRDRPADRLKGLLTLETGGEVPPSPISPEDALPLLLGDGKTTVPVFYFGQRAYAAAPVVYVWRRYCVQGKVFTPESVAWRQGASGLLSADYDGSCIAILQRAS